MDLKCFNKKCLHIWDYRGKILDENKLISCPKCHYRNLLKKLKVLTTQPEKPITRPTQSEYIKEIKRPQTDFIIGKKDAPTYDELADSIAGTNMKDGKAPRREDLPELPRYSD